MIINNDEFESPKRNCVGKLGFFLLVNEFDDSHVEFDDLRRRMLFLER